MSKLFYDHLVELEEVADQLKRRSDPDERAELEQLIDEMVHHRVLGCILDHLPREHHEEFLEKFHQAPYDDGLIVYLQQKTAKEVDIEKKIKEEVGKFKKELLLEIKKKK